MRGINHVFLVGHVGQDPELRSTANGRTLCNLSLATNRRTRQGDDWVDTTDWHRVTLWERDAETAARFVRKGRAIGVEGELRLSTWTDAAGQRHSRTEITGRRLHLIGRNPDSDAASSTPAAAPAAPPAADETQSIPF